MNWFRKKKKNTADPTVGAVTTGSFVKQEHLPDPMFSQGMMGPAFGILSRDGVVKAPFDGTVTMTFPTGHALGLKRTDGLEMLIHIGVDTVNLNGEGFCFLCAKDQTVTKGQKMIEFDPALIRSKGLDPTVICAFTSPVQGMTETEHPDEIRTGETLFEAVPEEG